MAISPRPAEIIEIPAATQREKRQKEKTLDDSVCAQPGKKERREEESGPVLPIVEGAGSSSSSSGPAAASTEPPLMAAAPPKKQEEEDEKESADSAQAQGNGEPLLPISSAAPSGDPPHFDMAADDTVHYPPDATEIAGEAGGDTAAAAQEGANAEEPTLEYSDDSQARLTKMIETRARNAMEAFSFTGLAAGEEKEDEVTAVL